MCLAHQSEIAVTPRAEQQTGDMIVGIAGKADRADLPCKDIASSRLQGVRIALQPHEEQFAVLNGLDKVQELTFSGQIA